MAASINKCTIMGYLGADPTIRNLNEGGRVASLSVATNEEWKNQDGEKQSRTDWHRVSVFSQPIVDLIEKALHKGSRVYLEGTLQTREWTDKDNVKRYSTELVIRPYSGELKLLDPKPEPEQPKQQARSTRRSGPQPAA